MDYSKFRWRCLSTCKLTPYYSLHCGSYFELPIKYCNFGVSDIDVMLYCSEVCAIPWNRKPPKNTKCTMLRIDSTETPSGYAKLKIHGAGKGRKPSYYHRPRMLANVKSGGPTIRHVDKNFNAIRELYQPRRWAVSEDMVFTIYCPYWPVEAEEWRKRKRFHGWPNEKLIARITRGGCHFVSKLRTWSSSDDTEWRFSFSKAELILIHSWTNVQKQVYNLTRNFKKLLADLFGGDGNKRMQTYYFKTLMFWACEEFPPEFWSEQNINTCVETLFLRFLRCLEDKYCPSYFIPTCNIMGHLEGEGRFDKELETLHKLLESGNVSYFCGLLPHYTEGHNRFLTESYEFTCLQMITSSFPATEYLGGRCTQYLSECEWFLPGMKNIHAAIEAHLRLMSLDNVTSRKENKDYVECFEHFKSALVINEDFQSLNYSNSELSFYENLNAILFRRQTRNSIPIYRRCIRKSFEGDVFDHMVKESTPSSLLWTVSCYRANFYFTAMQSYKESLAECNRCLHIMNNVNGDLKYHTSYIPVLICNSLSQIYDKYLQAILGFATLHRNISSSESTNFSTAHEVCLKLDAKEFLKYLYIQCEHKLSIKPEWIELNFPNWDFMMPCMSQLMRKNFYSAVILFAALQLSRVCRAPLKGNLIPINFSLVPNISAI